MPPLQTQVLDVPLVGGVDEKTRTELVTPASFTSLTNLRQLKKGSYQKRLGYAALSSLGFNGFSVPAAKRLIAYRDELLQTDGLSLYSRIPSMDMWKQVPGFAPQLSLRVTPTVSIQYSLVSHAVTVVNGYQVIVYTVQNTHLAATYSIYLSVLDSNGNIIIPPSALASVALPQVTVTSAGNVAVVLWAVSGSANLKVYTLDLSSPSTLATAAILLSLNSLGPSTNIITDMGNGACFDACSLGSTFVIAYVNTKANTAVANQLSIRSFNSALVQQAANTSTTTGAGAGAVPAVAVTGNASNVVFVAFGLDTGVTLNCVSLDPATLAQTKPSGTIAGAFANAIQTIGIVWISTDHAMLLCNTNDSSGPHPATIGMLRGVEILGASVTGSGLAPFNFFRMRLESKPFVANGRTYAMMRDAGPDNQSFLIDVAGTIFDSERDLSDIGYLVVAGNVNPRLSAPMLYPFNRMLSSVGVLSSTSAIVTTARLEGAIQSSLDVVTLDWAATNVAQPALLAEDVALSGSPPSYYDGVRVSEIGFFQRPRIISNTVVAAGILTGTYKYVATFEQIDNRGQWHQSNVSDVFTCSPQPVGENVRLIVSNLMASNRGSNRTSPAHGTQFVRTIFWRTMDGGNVFYRVPGLDTYSDPSTSTTTVRDDNFTDAELGAPLYSQPGIPGVAQVKVTPPCLPILIAHGDRLVGAIGKDVWFSGQNVSGEGYWFADLFQFAVEKGGDITALASMDGTLVIWKREAIAFVDGQGPPDNGAGGDFSPPQFMATDVGCINQNSVVLTPDGLIFQSLRGLELLTRARQIYQSESKPFFGSPVETMLAANPIITSAVLDEAKGVVIFTCLPNEGSFSGIELVWNYVFGVWTKETEQAANGITSAVMWGQQPGTVPVRTILQTIGGVCQESTSSYLDSGGWVTSTFETAWIKCGGGANGPNLGGPLQSFQRLRHVLLFCESKSPHDLTVSLAFDYSATYTEVHTFTAATLGALAREQIDIHVANQRCQAVRVKVVDATPTGGDTVGSGQGPIFLGLALEMGVKGGRMRLAAGAKG